VPRTLDPTGSGSPSATAGSARLVGEELVEKGRHGPLPGNERIGSQLGEWLEREAALVEVRVGHDETGFLVSGGDSAPFAERIDSLLADDALAERMSRAALAWSQRFDWELAAAAMERSLARAAESGA